MPRALAWLTVVAAAALIAVAPATTTAPDDAAAAEWGAAALRANLAYAPPATHGIGAALGIETGESDWAAAGAAVAEVRAAWAGVGVEQAPQQQPPSQPPTPIPPPVPLPPPPDTPAQRRGARIFAHGVASGDALADRFVVWTRVSVPPERAREPVAAVIVEVARAPEFRRRDLVSYGVAATDARVDFTVKLDVGGLPPATTYWYRFRAYGGVSAVGQARTLPRSTDAVPALGLAFVTCSAMNAGFFHAYRDVAQRGDIDAVVHLGDYIYEYSLEQYKPVNNWQVPPERVPQPNKELVTLADYRARYRQYRSDPDLRAMHAAKGVYAIWDDHEFVDNAWTNGSVHHDPRREGEWRDRKASAMRAWYEWLPVRPVIPDNGNRIWRSFTIGNLVELILLDTRMYHRDEQAKGRDQDRQLLGDDQRAWLFDKLASKSTKWRVVGNQVMLTSKPTQIFGWDANILNDDWSGYPRDRNALLRHINDRKLTGILWFTGDFHASVASDVTLDGVRYDSNTGQGAIVPEFVIPSVTSPSPIGDSRRLEGPAINTFRRFNQGVKFMDMVNHGYTTLFVGANDAAARVEYVYVANIQDPNGAAARVARTLRVDNNNPAIRQ